MLYKFIIWTRWAKTQSYIGSNPNSVLTIGAVYEKNLVYSESISGAAFKMEEASPHQVDTNLHQVESRGSQHSNPCRSLERRGDLEGSMHAAHTSKSQSRGKSRVSHAKNDKDMQREIDESKRELRHARRRRSSPNSELSSEETDGASYRRRSRTPPNKSFSYDEEYHHRCRYKNPPRKGLGNDAMNKALSQISKSPFTRNIEDASLPRWFHQPTFTIYNGRTDPVEHVSHFYKKDGHSFQRWGFDV